MKFKTRLKDQHGSVWGQHIMVPQKVADHFAQKKIKRIICTINNSHDLHGAIMPNTDGTRYITLNKELSRNLKLKVGDELSIEITEDKSKYGMPMPEEMDELLKMDPESDAYFHKLTPGKQRTLLYLIAKPKTSDTRLKKAVIITEYLKMVNGKLDFKELNEAFKQAN